MSISFLKISCSECDFSGSSLVAFGTFRYKSENSYFDLDRSFGLCLDCNAIVPIEILPDADTFHRAKQLRKTYTGRPLLKLLEKDVAKYLASQQNFEILEKVIDLNRKSVCLECGKAAIRELEIPKNVSDTFWINIDQSHPWCSGKLQVKHSGSLRIAPQEITKLYNIYGELISTHPTDRHPYDI